MSRTLRLKILYVVLLAGLTVLAFWFIRALFPGREFVGALVGGAVLLLPGRIQGIVFRDLFRGRRALSRGSSDKAVEYFQAFIEQMQRSPGRKRFIWFAWTVYTIDAEAMAWNNIGAACLRMGDWAGAKDAGMRALALDPKYPLPHVTLAGVAVANGDRAEVEHHLRQARHLGYRATSADQLISRLQGLLASVEGRGDAS